jgi:hypothetical protein
MQRRPEMNLVLISVRNTSAYSPVLGVGVGVGVGRVGRVGVGRGSVGDGCGRCSPTVLRVIGITSGSLGYPNIANESPVTLYRRVGNGGSVWASGVYPPALAGR